MRECRAGKGFVKNECLQCHIKEKVVQVLFLHQTGSNKFCIPGYIKVVVVFSTDSSIFIFEQSRAPPHCSTIVQHIFNRVAKLLWIMFLCCHSSPKTPNLRICDFFLWSYVEDKAYASVIGTMMQTLQEHITAAVPYS
ncbi:hypothetical protein TNCV_4411261 [Trichonephila clavipes]|nr:hypothetical protein TNCV_4411261 [Trichonephila clavipes]